MPAPPTDISRTQRSNAAKSRQRRRGGKKPGRRRRLALEFRSWGGRRRGAGRKPAGKRAGVSHLHREGPNPRRPVHVTLRLRADVWNLRSGRMFRALYNAFVGGKARFGFRLVHYSVQGNHVHIVAEAPDRRALSRGVQGLCVRIARRLNRVMGRRGKVFADRFHSRVLESPLEVRRVLSYVLGNAQRHAVRNGRRFIPGWVDPYSSAVWFDGWRGTHGVPMAYVAFADPRAAPLGPRDPRAGPGAECEVATARGLMLRRGWRRHGLLDLTAT
jgi:REP element-mobilizing transposase RayT